VIPVIPVSGLPEKIGQVVAELHFVAVAAVVRNLIKKRRLVKSVTTKGILIDKLNGVIRCELTVKVSTPDKPVSLQLLCVDHSGMDTSEYLCKAFQDLL